MDMIRGKTRHILVLLHRWLSLAVGLVFGVAVLTAAPLVFQHEIDGWLSADAYQPTPGDIGWEAALAVIQQDLRAGERVVTFWWPRPQVPAYNAWIEGGEEGRMVYLDPGTGALMDPEPSALTGWLVTLHTTLFAGTIGYWVVAIATALSIPILITGMFLWWPGIKHFWRGLRIRWRKGTYPLNYDLHQVGGMITTVPLLIMCVTGVIMAFPEASRTTLQTMLGQEPSGRVDWGSVRSAGPPEGWDPSQRLEPGDFLRIAEDAVPGEHHRFYLAFPPPEDPQDVVHTRLQVGYDPPPFGITIRVAHDPYTGEILQVIDPRQDGSVDRFVDSVAHSWHFGSFGGFWVKLAYFVSCLIGVLLVITGTVVWWKKRSTRVAREARKVGREKETGAVAGEGRPAPVSALRSPVVPPG
jgi:uncharacterized iron-regulated membrane protein